MVVRKLSFVGCYLLGCDASTVFDKYLYFRGRLYKREERLELGMQVKQLCIWQMSISSCFVWCVYIYFIGKLFSGAIGHAVIIL
jgi:hypothetical protein